MKRTLQYVIILIAAIMQPSLAHTQETLRQGDETTLKTQLEILHETFGVNFVYDSSIDLDIPCKGLSTRPDRGSLEGSLQTLLAGTGIEYEIMKKYIVLTKAGSKKKPKDYTIFIEEQRDTLAESRITAIADPQRNTTQTGMTRVDGSKINKGFAFLSSPDLIKTLQMLPGVSSGTELMSGLYVHGGTGSDNLYLLDNVPMYQVSHLAGLFSSFNHEMVDNVDFYKSGFPSRYGGRMSSVVDVMTRPGDMQEYHGAFSIGLIDGNIQLEGPIIKDRTSFNIALRRSWVDFVTTPIFAIINRNSPDDNTSLSYNFWDANAGITHIVDKNNRIYLNFYAGDDRLKTGEYYDNEYEDYLGNPQHTWFDSGIKVTWGNILASAGWKSQLTSNIQSNVVAYYSLSRSKMAYEFESKEGVAEVIEEFDTSGNISNVSSIGAKSMFIWTPHRMHKVRFGGGYQYHMYDITRFKESRYTENGVAGAPAETKDNADYCGHEMSMYIEDEMQLTDWFAANAGLRYVLFGVPGKVYNAFEPRVALKFQCADFLAAKASYTEMTQFNHQIATSYVDLPSNSWMPVTANIAPMHSRQVAGGLYFSLPYGLVFNLEGWWKTMDNLREYSGSNSLFPPLTQWEASFSKGRGRSYGAEVEFAWRKPKVDISAYYTLSWNERYFDDIYNDWYPDRNDHRHKLTLSASYKFTKNFEAYAAWNFHSGSRFTVATQVVSEKVDPEEMEDLVIFGPFDGFRHQYFYSSPNNVKMPAYHRLDIGFNFRKTTKRGNESIWNLSVYNAYCRMNPLIAFADYDAERSRFVGKANGIVPIIPSFSYTLRF